MNFKVSSINIARCLSHTSNNFANILHHIIEFPFLSIQRPFNKKRVFIPQEWAQKDFLACLKFFMGLLHCYSTTKFAWNLNIELWWFLFLACVFCPSQTMSHPPLPGMLECCKYFQEDLFSLKSMYLVAPDRILNGSRMGRPVKPSTMRRSIG